MRVTRHNAVQCCLVLKSETAHLIEPPKPNRWIIMPQWAEQKIMSVHFQMFQTPLSLGDTPITMLTLYYSNWTKVVHQAGLPPPTRPNQLPKETKSEPKPIVASVTRPYLTTVYRKTDPNWNKLNLSDISLSLGCHTHTHIVTHSFSDRKGEIRLRLQENNST